MDSGWWQVHSAFALVSLRLHTHANNLRLIGALISSTLTYVLYLLNSDFKGKHWYNVVSSRLLFAGTVIL
jgi:hypothetical protein